MPCIHIWVYLGRCFQGSLTDAGIYARKSGNNAFSFLSFVTCRGIKKLVPTMTDERWSYYSTFPAIFDWIRSTLSRHQPLLFCVASSMILGQKLWKKSLIHSPSQNPPWGSSHLVTGSPVVEVSIHNAAFSDVSPVWVLESCLHIIN